MQDKHDFTGPPITSTTDVRKTFQQHEKLPYLISTYPFYEFLNMSITLVPRTFKCNACGVDHQKSTVVISDNRVIPAQFTEDHIEDPEDVSGPALYTYNVIRDTYGVIEYREAVKIKCAHCQSKDIFPYPRERYDNVLNFYAPGNTEKWFRGFEDLGKR